MSKASLLPLDKLDPTVEYVWKPTARAAVGCPAGRSLVSSPRLGLRGRNCGGRHRRPGRYPLAKSSASPKEAIKRPPIIDGLHRSTHDRAAGCHQAGGHPACRLVAWHDRGRRATREKLALFWHNHFATSIKKVAPMAR